MMAADADAAAIRGEKRDDDPVAVLPPKPLPAPLPLPDEAASL